MKKLRIIALVSILALVSTDTFAGWFQNWRMQRQQRQVEQTSPGAVGAPIDGGLLAILAAAGGAYFIARKRKKKQQ